tara:strand:- start:243 stop:656 length:414 start_codon:yes stop_codon:yes gene_type:complete
MKNFKKVLRENIQTRKYGVQQEGIKSFFSKIFGNLPNLKHASLGFESSELGQYIINNLKATMKKSELRDYSDDAIKEVGRTLYARIIATMEENPGLSPQDIKELIDQQVELFDISVKKSTEDEDEFPEDEDTEIIER